MNNEDLVVAKKVYDKKRISELDICKVLRFKDKDLDFSERYLFDGQISIMLPEDYDDMKLEYIKRKFLSADRPEIIISSADTVTCFTFSMLDEEYGENDVAEIINAIKAVIKRKNPANLFFSKKVDKTDQDISFGYCEYMSYALDGDIYNTIYIMPSGAKLLVGTFSTHYDDKDFWQYLVRQIMKTVTFHNAS